MWRINNYFLAVLSSESPAFSAVFERVKPPTTFEETVARLGTAIRLGVLAPGARLPPERDLSEQLGISRSTLRQALRALTESGHLVAVRGRAGGTFVAEAPPIAAGEAVELDHGAWRALFDYRIAIELGAVHLATERATPADLDRLDELTAAMAAAADWPAYRRADVFFHLAIAEAARAPRLVAAMTDVHGRLSELLDPAPHPATVLGFSNDQHAAIAAAIRSRRPARAVARMREHLEGTERLIEGLVPKLP